MAQITFIICNRGGEHIDFVINKYKEYYPNENFIIINQTDNLPFMRGQLFNIAYMHTNTPYLCFCDNDMFFKEYVDLIDIYNKLECKVLQPLINITQIKINDDNKTYKTLETNKKGPWSTGGISFISKENFINLNGFSNLYLGYGCEDTEMFNRSWQYYKDYDINVCHIKHDVRCNYNKQNTNLNVQFARDHSRDNTLDSYIHTVFNYTKLPYKKNNILYLNVSGIYVNNNFGYKNLLNKHYKYIKK